MAGTMRDWLGPRIDEGIAARLRQAQEEKQVTAENAESEKGDSRFFLKISLPRGGFLQILQVRPGND
jgi:hypothetical protein